MTIEAWIAVVRFAHVGASLFLFGGLAFAIYAGREALGNITERMLAAIALATNLAWIGLMAIAIGGAQIWAEPSRLGVILLKTSFGSMWLVHAALTALTLTIALGDWSRRWRLGAVVSGAQTASFALIGHSAAGEGASGALLLGAHAVHVLSAGAWMGGVYALQRVLRKLDEASAQETLRRFSGAGYVMVTALVLCGFVNLRLTAHQWLPDPAISYGALIAVKIVLAAALLGLAAFNRLFASHPARRGLLYRSIAAEHVLFAAVFFAAALAAGASPHA